MRWVRAIAVGWPSCLLLARLEGGIVQPHPAAVPWDSSLSWAGMGLKALEVLQAHSCLHPFLVALPQART